LAIKQERINVIELFISKGFVPQGTHESVYYVFNFLILKGYNELLEKIALPDIDLTKIINSIVFFHFMRIRFTQH